MLRQRARLAGIAGPGYHRWARDMLRCLDQLTAGIAAAHAGRDPRLAGLRECYCRFERRLRRHLAWEDAQLFPLLAALEQDARPATAARTAATMAVTAELRLAHDEFARLLDQLAGYSDDFAAPGWASLDHRLMLDQLHRLAAETREHLRGGQAALPPLPDDR